MFPTATWFVSVFLFQFEDNNLLPLDPLQDFTADFYFRTYWNDPRLAFANKSNVEKITLGHDFGKAIWLPDLFFVQAKKDSFMHTITSKNEFIKVDHEGNVARSIRYRAASMTIDSRELFTRNCMQVVGEGSVPDELPPLPEGRSNMCAQRREL